MTVYTNYSFTMELKSLRKWQSYRFHRRRQTNGSDFRTTDSFPSTNRNRHFSSSFARDGFVSVFTRLRRGETRHSRHGDDKSRGVDQFSRFGRGKYSRKNLNASPKHVAAANTRTPPVKKIITS